MGIEPTLPPCKGGVLPLNYGPVKIMVGAAGLEPAPPCSQSRCATSALRSDMAASTMLTAPPAGEAQQEPAGNVEAVIPMTTAPGRDESKNSYVPTDHRHVAAPVPATAGGYFQNGKHHVLWSLPVRGNYPGFPDSSFMRSGSGTGY